MTICDLDEGQRGDVGRWLDESRARPRSLYASFHSHFFLRCLVARESEAVHGKLSTAYRLTGTCLQGPMPSERVSENSNNKLSLPIVYGHRSREQLSFMYIYPHYIFWCGALGPDGWGYCLSHVHSRLTHLPTSGSGRSVRSSRCDFSVRYYCKILGPGSTRAEREQHKCIWP